MNVCICPKSFVQIRTQRSDPIELSLMAKDTDVDAPAEEKAAQASWLKSDKVPSHMSQFKLLFLKLD